MADFSKLVSSLKNSYSDFKDDASEYFDQQKANLATDKEREQAVNERNKLMGDMEYQQRAQHQMQKEFPTYSATYGNRAIYNPKQDLSGFADTPEIKPLIDDLKRDSSLGNLYDRSFQLRDAGQNLAAQALGKDLLKSQGTADFIDKLRNSDKLNYKAELAPLLKSRNHIAETGIDPTDKSRKLIQTDPEYQNDLGTWLHEHLHAKNPKDSDTQEEKINTMLEDPNVKEAIIPQILKTNDIAGLRQQISGGHFMDKPNTLPELYVQDKFEDVMKNRGFDTRKDPVKSRFDRLKQLMRY